MPQIIIAVASQKGGAGKTTATINLAGAAVEQKKKVVILDIDPQSSATVWSDGRDDNEAPRVESIQHARLQQALDANKDADLILIDTAPHAEAGVLAAAKAAHMMIVPCRPAFLDLLAIEDTLEIAKMAKVPAYVLMNAARPHAPRQDEDFRDAIKGIPANMFKSPIHDRAACQHSIGYGKTVIDHEPKGKAADEFRALFREVTRKAKR